MLFAGKEIKIDQPDEKVREKVQNNWDHIAKPLDGMGVFEGIIARIGAIQKTDRPDISKKALIIMCADNGVIQEGVSQSDQTVTAVVASQMTKGRTSVGRMCRLENVDSMPVDIGMNIDHPIEGMIQRSIRRGTENFAKKPAMTEADMVKAIETGIDLVSKCSENGYGLIATGEMGIGNTTTSSAVCASLLGCSPEKVTGRGAGLDDDSLMRKIKVIKAAISRYSLSSAVPSEILRTVGGLDIAGLAGVCIGGAVYHLPVVLDGVITLTAALAAERMLPGCREYMIASHKGKEPASALICSELGLRPVIDADMALGEGTGAIMEMSLLDMAMAVYDSTYTFDQGNLEQYSRYDIKDNI